MSNKSLSLIIDADIGRSSGTSEHPVSSSARQLLESVKSNGHYAAMSPALMAEWNKHKSVYATRWLASMTAKRRVKRIKPDTQTRDYIAARVKHEKSKNIALKDAHLIDAALSQSKVVLSNDDNARDVFCAIATDHRRINRIIWLHSITDKAFIRDYLQSRCFVPEHYYLKKP